MTVTELREALQAIEAQGHGALRCVVKEDFRERFWLEPADPRIEAVGSCYGDTEFPAGSTVVIL